MVAILDFAIIDIFSTYKKMQSFFLDLHEKSILTDKLHSQTMDQH